MIMLAENIVEVFFNRIKTKMSHIDWLIMTMISLDESNEINFV